MSDSTTDSRPGGAPDEELDRADREIADLSSRAYPDRDEECDVIMKGGITSGVVYPLTICKLATKYRLRSIGGASAGAIAAAIAAAAEYRRRQGGPGADQGYRALAELPNEVSERLTGLFQPLPTTKRMFDVLFAAIDPDATGAARVWGVVRTIVARKLAWFVAGLLATLAIAVPGLVITTGFPFTAGDWWRLLIGLALPLVAGVVVGTVTAAVGLAFDALRVLPTTGFGLTDGSTHGEHEGLTDWLAGRIDDVAGIADRDRCLTLGDLWGAAAVDAWATSVDAGQWGDGPTWQVRAERRIQLEVMTTNLTLRRPFRLPFTQQIFLFDESEMRKLFPDRAVDAMLVKQSDHLHPDTGAPLWWFPGVGKRVVDGTDFPGPAALPVIVMARMSLSFPGLIGAVPLYAVDFDGDQSVVRMWFSDGGVSSNFPMHFFDAMLPTRPTFGVNLQPVHPVDPRRVERPSPTSGGTIPRAKPFDSVPEFVGSLRDTMQNWSDNKQLTQRGYADRVVEIRLAPDEGGMNLRMPKELVLRLAARGAAAGDELLTFDWDAHRVIRYRVAMARLTDVLDQLVASWRRGDGSLYPDLIANYPSSGAAGVSYLGGTTWREHDREATEALAGLVDEWRRLGWPGLDAKFPTPSPIVAMVPR